MYGKEPRIISSSPLKFTCSKLKMGFSVQEFDLEAYNREHLYHQYLLDHTLTNSCDYHLYYDELTQKPCDLPFSCERVHKFQHDFL